MSRVKLTVTVDDEHLESMQSVTTQLQSNGFVVDHVVEFAGAIFGSADTAKIPTLSHLQGVADVHPERGYSLPSMDPAIPQ